MQSSPHSPLPVSDVASLVFLFWLGDFSFSCNKGKNINMNLTFHILIKW